MTVTVQERIGIYGGTFDPIHYGHLRVAAAICEAFDFDRLLLMPAFIPPHKRDRVIASAYHRYTMAVLAAMQEFQSQRTKTTVSTLELDAPARPYTIETMELVQTHYPQASLFFIMGGDSFAEINLWREHDRLMTEYSLIVAARPPSESLRIQHLSPLCQQRVVDLRGSKRPELNAFNEPHIYLTDYVFEPIAATQIRNAVQQGESIDHFVPSDVARYIAIYELYRNQTGN